MLRITALLLALLVFAGPAGASRVQDPYRQLEEATPVPMGLDSAFEFRKVKTFLLGSAPGPRRAGGFTRGLVRDPSVTFESAYLLHGAVTALDQQRRFGNYFDFFWRAKRPADVTVRLEYRQQRLRSFTQAREVVYPNVRAGNHKTSFAVTGDDFATDGRIISWRCLLIVKGRVVAEEKSFLWR